MGAAAVAGVTAFAGAAGALFEDGLRLRCAGGRLPLLCGCGAAVGGAALDPAGSAVERSRC